MRRAALVALVLLVTASAASAQLRPADAPPPINDTRCGAECVRCAADGCIKCARLLVWPGGTCAHDCPSGTRESWAHDDHLMGRVCYPSHTYNEVIVGGACGAVVCIALVAAGAAYARCRTSRAHAQLPQRAQHDDDTRLREFHKQLDCLRVTETNVTRLERYRRVQFIQHHFWQRFNTEYVSLLQQKTKWHRSTGALADGALVLIRDKTLPPLLWLLGRVIRSHQGADGIARVAEIKTKKGTITRAYNNICPLPIS